MDLESYNCVLCHLDAEESLLHLFFHCPFAASCWNVLGLAHLIQEDPFQTFSAFKEIVVAMCWAIWSARNDLIFRHQQHSIDS